MIPHNFDATQHLLNEIDLIGYINVDIAIDIQHKLMELQLNLVNSLENIKNFSVSDLNNTTIETIQFKLNILNKNLEVINEFIKITMYDTTFTFNKFNFILN